MNSFSEVISSILFAIWFYPFLGFINFIFSLENIVCKSLFFIFKIIFG